MSAARLKRYLVVADNDLRIAMRLHAWNAAVAGSLLPTLHLTEVAIRNFALKRLIAKYGKHWYSNSTLLDYRLSKKLSNESAMPLSVSSISVDEETCRTTSPVS